MSELEASVCFGVIKDCKNLWGSCGEICVHCNACGRFDAKTQKESYLKLLKRELQEQYEFDDWATEYPELVKLQKFNIQANISNLEAKIKKLEENQK